MRTPILMQQRAFRIRALAFVAGVAVLAFSGWASADPPSRVARLGYTSGAVSFSPAGEDDWVRSTINRPLTTGDRLWSDAGARAEVQIGGAMIRMGAGTGVSVLNLDDRIAQLQLTQGVLNVRVRRLEPGQVLEVDTPNLAFALRQPGEYRIEVDPDGSATTIVMRKGQGDVYGEGAAYVIDSRQPYRFTGTGLREYQYVDTPRLDEFDRWSSDRDRNYDNSPSARYVSQDVVGYQDLDVNGTWRVDASYGNVWIPNRVATGWAPYRDGHWVWVDPWGWTWVDDAPWGFAVSHYGRWTNLRGTWGWVPGPVQTRAYYAPALVAFVGGPNFQIAISSGNVGGVAWFPLAPREVYRPSYVVSRGYFENINRSNTVVNNTVINNYYNNSNVTNIVYANRQVPGAVIAVPATTFVQSQPVSRALVKLPREMIVSGPVAIAPHAVPTEKSVRGAAAQGDKPPARVFERPVIARAAPPAAPAGFTAQQPQLSAKPGKPLDDAARKELKPVVAAAAPVVKVVAQSQDAPKALRPPPAVASARPSDERGRSDDRKAPAVTATPGAPSAPKQGAASAPATPPVPTAQAPEQRGKSDQRGKADQRAQPVAIPAPATQPQVASPAPTAQTPEQRAKAEQPGKGGEQRGQAVAPPAPPPTAAPAAKAALPPPVAQPAAAQPPEKRAKAEQPGKGEQRVQAVEAPPVPPPSAAPAKVASPPPVAQPAAAQLPEQGAKAEQRGKGEQRAQAVAAPPVPPPSAAPTKVASPPPVAQPAPAVPSPEQGAKAEQRGKGEQRAQAVAMPPVPPPSAAPAKVAPPPVVASPVPVAQQARPAPGSSAKQPGPLIPAAAPDAPPPLPAPAPKAEPKGEEPKPIVGKPIDMKKDSEAQKREETERKP